MLSSHFFYCNADFHYTQCCHAESYHADCRMLSLVAPLKLVHCLCCKTKQIDTKTEAESKRLRQTDRQRERKKAKDIQTYSRDIGAERQKEKMFACFIISYQNQPYLLKKQAPSLTHKYQTQSSVTTKKVLQRLPFE